MKGVPRGIEDAGRVLPREALGQLARNRPKAFVERCLPSAHGRFSTFGVAQCGQAPRCMAQTNRVGRPSTGTNWKWRVSKRSQPDPRRPEGKQVDFQVAVAALGAAQAAVATDEVGQLVDAIQYGARFHLACRKFVFVAVWILYSLVCLNIKNRRPRAPRASRPVRRVLSRLRRHRCDP